MNYYTAALKKYATFSGRAQRKKYWTLVLVFWLIVAVLGGISKLFEKDSRTYSMIMMVLGIHALLHIIPIVAVSVHRLHDTGRSG